MTHLITYAIGAVNGPVKNKMIDCVRKLLNCEMNGFREGTLRIVNMYIVFNAEFIFIIILFLYIFIFL